MLYSEKIYIFHCVYVFVTTVEALIVMALSPYRCYLFIPQHALVFNLNLFI